MCFPIGASSLVKVSWKLSRINSGLLIWSPLVAKLIVNTRVTIALSYEGSLPTHYSNWNS